MIEDGAHRDSQHWQAAHAIRPRPEMQTSKHDII